MVYLMTNQLVVVVCSEVWSFGNLTIEFAMDMDNYVGVCGYMLWNNTKPITNSKHPCRTFGSRYYRILSLAGVLVFYIPAIMDEYSTSMKYYAYYKEPQMSLYVPKESVHSTLRTHTY